MLIAILKIMVESFEARTKRWNQIPVSLPASLRQDVMSNNTDTSRSSSPSYSVFGDDLSIDDSTFPRRNRSGGSLTADALSKHSQLASKDEGYSALVGTSISLPIPPNWLSKEELSQKASVSKSSVSEAPRRHSPVRDPAHFLLERKNTTARSKIKSENRPSSKDLNKSENRSVPSPQPIISEPTHYKQTSKDEKVSKGASREVGVQKVATKQSGDRARVEEPFPSQSLSSNIADEASTRFDSTEGGRGSQVSERSRSNPRQKAVNTLRRSLKSAFSLVAPSSKFGIRSLLGLLFGYTDALISTGSIPDAEDFESFLAIFISEIADNTFASSDLPSYPSKRNIGTEEEPTYLESPFSKHPGEGREGMRYKILTSGTNALQRCGLDFLRSPTALPGKSSKRINKKPALEDLVKDFVFYDPLRAARGLPSASDVGASFRRGSSSPLHCMIFKSKPAGKDGKSPPPSTTKGRSKLIETLYQKVMQSARDVGVALAKIQLPDGGERVNQRGLSNDGVPVHLLSYIKPQVLNCNRFGLMQYLEKAKDFLSNFDGNRRLSIFLSHAIDSALKRIRDICHLSLSLYGNAGSCDTRAPNDGASAAVSPETLLSMLGPGTLRSVLMKLGVAVKEPSWNRV